MTAPNPATWPIPEPQDGLTEAIRLVDAIVDAGAMDEEHPHIFDPTIDTWVDVWTHSAQDERERTCAQVQKDLDVAHAEEQFAKQNLHDAEARLAIARATLIDTGLRPEPRVTVAAGRADAEQAETADQVGAVGPETSSGTARTATAVAPVLVPEPTDARARVMTIGPWILLLLMGIADAYGFWQTLVTVIQHQDLLTLFFVVALVLGAILVAHQIGRLTRQYRTGHAPGARPWIVVMSCAWFALGVLILWIRAHPPAVSSDIFAPSASSGTGLFAPGSAAATPSAAADTASWASTWGIATLFFILYCLTGVLAMTHAFQAADERPRHRKLALASVGNGQADVASARYFDRLAQRNTARLTALLEKTSRDRSAEADCEANGLNIKQQVRIHLSGRLGSGSATTAVTEPQVPRPQGPRVDDVFDGPAVPSDHTEQGPPDDGSDDEIRGDRP